MALLNYTTTIAVEKTTAEIQKALASAGASGVMTQYTDKIMSAITFQIETPHGSMYFTLPANIDKVQVVLQSSGLERRFGTREHAAKVAWRIIKVWIEAQLALVETEMVEMAEVFLPYMQTDTGESLYKRLSENKFYLPAP